MLRQLLRKLKYGTFWLYVLDRLEHIGILVRPFYLVEEGLHVDSPGMVARADGQHTLRALTEADIQVLLESTRLQGTIEAFRDRFEDGCGCFGLVADDGTIKGLSWVNFSVCRSWIEFPLEDDQAYLFDARVFDEYRGLGLAPLLRLRVYEYLSSVGRTRCLSVTDAFNVPARKFKARLGARPVRLYLLVAFAQRFKKLVLLKQYP